MQGNSQPQRVADAEARLEEALKDVRCRTRLRRAVSKTERAMESDVRKIKENLGRKA